MKPIYRYGVIAVTLLFIALSVYLASCAKKAASEDIAENGGTAIYGFYSSCGAPLNGSTVVEVIRDVDDPNDDRVTLIQYHYARAIKQVAKNNTFRCYLVNSILSETSPEKEISISQLAQENSAFGAALNIELRASINASESANIYPRGISGESGIDQLRSSPTWNADAFLSSKLTYAGINYFPAIYFMKRPATCETSGPLTILIAQDVDDCDDVAGWRGDDEVIMSEGDVRASTEPSIFVGPGFATYQSLQNPPEKLDDQSVTDRDDLVLILDGYQVNNGFRFESAFQGKSDVRGWVIVSKFSDNSIIKDRDFSIDDIKRSDVQASKEFFTDIPFLSVSESSYNNDRFFFGAYEHDWYVLQSRTVTNNCLPTGVTSLDKQIRAKFASDIYQRNCFPQPVGTFVLDPNNNTYQTLSIAFPGVAGSSTFTYKGNGNF